MQTIAAFGFFIDLDVGETFGTIDSDELRISVDFGTWHATVFVRTAGHAQTDHATAFHIRSAREHFEIDIFHHVSQLGEFELNTHVRFVGAVFRHRGGEIHHRERIRQIDVECVLEGLANHAFKQIADFLFGHERSFAIDLGKFRLTISTQVFVAEAFGDLIVTIEVGHHQQLLEQLR